MLCMLLAIAVSLIALTLHKVALALRMILEHCDKLHDRNKRPSLYRTSMGSHSHIQQH